MSRYHLQKEIFTVSGKVMKALKMISLRIAAQKRKPHKAEETLTILEAIDMCKIIHGSKVAKSLKSFLVSRESTY